MKNSRVLAVIPARAGSKGIPNKNIRIVGGHPLAWWSIRNALESTMISDVVVTTDSDTVASLARAMGANVHWRDARLCADDVTLDEVVFDAMPAGEWDYVVTMQPTSPTLKTETLDAAIAYAIDNDLDTLISSINRPHLAWVERDGVKVPDYAERLNRQWLPPRYLETGAFVISRASVVNEYTRIGERVDVFEVPESEAIDVDTFEDLRSVEALLHEERVAIYVNGNPARGTGHVYRALELADEFYCKPDIIYDINQTNPVVFGETTHTIVGVDGIGELFERCGTENYTLVINDVLDTTIDYMIALRRSCPGAHIVNFEDEGEGGMAADLTFNALYQGPESGCIRAGAPYYICPKHFLFYSPIKITEKVREVLVTFGGSDPQGYTDRVLETVASDLAFEGYQFTFVLGRAKQNADALIAKYNNMENITILHDVPNMPELMGRADIAITSRGRTGYELAMMGVPTIAMAQNAREERHSFVSNENGFTYLGLNPPDEVIKSNLSMYLGLSQKARQRFQDMLLAHNLRDGRHRVMGLINSL